MIKKIYRYFKRLLNHQKVFEKAKRFLSAGFYKIDNNSIKKCAFSRYCCLTDGKLGRLTTCLFSVGGGKIVLILPDYVIGFYKTQTLYNMSKKNLSNIHRLVYPHVEVVGFDDSNISIKMERINGRYLNDIEHNKIILECLFEFAIKSETRTENGNVLMLQHGDAKPENILWKENGGFVFIDLDGCGFFPAFFDIIHFCQSIKFQFEEIEKLLLDHFDVICKVLKRDIPLVECIDEILSGYLSYYLKIHSYYNDFSFMNYANTKKYVKTNNLLKKILN